MKAYKTNESINAEIPYLSLCLYLSLSLSLSLGGGGEVIIHYLIQQPRQSVKQASFGMFSVV
jgi:hypothetical protein